MDFAHLTKNLTAARRARNFLFVTLALSVVANVFLSFRILQESNQVVLVPSTVRDGMVVRGQYDKSYLEALALDAVYAMYTTSPSTLAYGRTTLERISSSKERSEILKQYDEVAQDIKNRKISTVFLAEKVEHRPDRLELVVVGRLATFLENIQVDSQQRRIFLQFRAQAGSTRLERIGLLEGDN